MSKIEKFLFYLLIFSIPFQTRYILYQWPARIAGQSAAGGGSGFNEWTSVYLYLTDILLILIFLFWFWRNKNKRYLKQRPYFSIKKPSFWLVLFIIIGFVSIIKAQNIGLAFYSWFKLLEMAGLFFYLRSQRLREFREQREQRGLPSDESEGSPLFRRLAQIFVLSALFQSFIAIKQYFNQASLGLKYLAESPLSADILGVAKIVVNELKIIRPYGAFPHPNVLAAYLLAAIFFLYYLWLKKEHSRPIHYFFFVIFFFLLFSLLLTFSRVIIFAFIAVSLFFFFACFRKVIQEIDLDLLKRAALIFFIFVIVCSFFAFVAWPEISSRFKVSPTEQAVYLRNFYNETALSFIQQYPWLGIGIGNFVSEIREMFNLLQSWLHQPVHNIYLLIAAETGLIGLIFFLLFIIRLLALSLRGSERSEPTEAISTARPDNYFIVSFIVKAVLLSFLFIGLFDHFFLTLQQGQLLFWLVLGIIANDNLKYISEEV